ncbi:hypothetical protein Tco_0527286 [Tanacetum coccineum]
MNDCLCVFASPNINCKKNEDVEIWVMRSYNVQESWERKLPPLEGSGAPVLVRSIERPYNLDSRYAHIRLSTNSECNYNYNHHVFVKSLVSPHGMGDGDGDGDGGDHNVNDVIPVVDKIEELAQEYMEHLEHGKRTRIKKT